ncbi:class F sortase [Streptomyces sp. NPDC053367]|uniref:class F sortase n=1 Tax=Streptomyces sp. NPDC053367 TaxID=3365700 RepID=UPI0037D79C38
MSATGDRTDARGAPRHGDGGPDDAARRAPAAPPHRAGDPAPRRSAAQERGAGTRDARGAGKRDARDARGAGRPGVREAGKPSARGAGKRDARGAGKRDAQGAEKQNARRSGRPEAGKPPGRGPGKPHGRGAAEPHASRPAAQPPRGSRTPPPRSPKAGPSPSRSRKAAPPLPRPHPLPRSRATRLTIDYIGVDAPVMSLRLDSRRRLPAPPADDANLVGWYADGPSPGEQGTAVAVGHLDTDTGPAVFTGLTELERGRLVEVTRADGRTAVYAVDAVRTYEKDRFPNGEVYGARGRPELRLITCGGDYDRRNGYSGNVVVFAHLVDTHGPSPAAARR